MVYLAKMLLRELFCNGECYYKQYEHERHEPNFCVILTYTLSKELVDATKDIVMANEFMS